MENLYTTDMPKLVEVCGYRNEIYKNHNPAANWLEAKSLALPGFMIEIELKVYVGSR